MRYATPVYFQRITSTYDEATGNYTDHTAESIRWADICDTGEETMRLVYGRIRQGSKTMQLQRPYTQPFDTVRIGTKIYTAETSRSLLTKASYVLTEVQ